MRATDISRAISRGGVRELANRLQSCLEGEALFDDASRALYAHDLSIYRHVPIGVVIPRHKDDVAATVAACREHSIPILGRGCGTSLSGQACNVAVVIDFSKYMNRVLEVDPHKHTARVEPGAILDDLRHAAEQHGLTFAPDPATHEYCTLGGMIGNNSCGAHSVMGGKTVDNTCELEILTYAGERFTVGKTIPDAFRRIVRDGGRKGEIHSKLKALIDAVADEVRRQFPRIPRRVSGYNLDQLLPENDFNIARALVGSEGTCALTLEATLNLMPSPMFRTLLLIGYPDWGAAGDHASEIVQTGPIAVEGFDIRILENLRRKGDDPPGRKLLPQGRLKLLAEYGGESQGEATARANAALERLKRAGDKAEMRVFADPADQRAIWAIREAGLGASRVPGKEDSWPSWEDTAVSVEKLGAYLRDFEKLIDRYQYRCTLYGHFGQGCVHTRFDFDLKSEPGVRKFRHFVEDGADLVAAYGGSLSGEHGDGQAKAELLGRMYGPVILKAFRDFKAIWDPDWKLNPGKMVDPFPLDDNLRTGPDYRPWRPKTHFAFPEDAGSIAQATERCFGVGLCRGLSDKRTMCPSFVATREERHTTRGRAHLLFELFRGETLRDGWFNKDVKDALDLCLQCKGCKGDCPAKVDMATYKAEFLSHYYESNWRPRAAYFAGYLNRWAPYAFPFAPALNIATHAPGLRQLANVIAGFHHATTLPKLTTSPFINRFKRRQRPQGKGRRVLLWPDTFSNYFAPERAEAAVRVLEAAGYEVEIPSERLCCGRPLYEFGLLDQAKQELRRTLKGLEKQIEAGTPVIGVEPSCVSVLRDELLNLLPGDALAGRLASQAKLLCEFLGEDGVYVPPRLQGRAVVHLHCHQKAVLKGASETAVLQRAGLQAEALETGCCGMAGSFGFQHPDLSAKIGEAALFPAVRLAEQDTLVIASGFSCRHQIAMHTGRKPIHFAEALAQGL